VAVLLPVFQDARQGHNGCNRWSCSTQRTTAGSKVKRGDRIELVRDRLPYSLEVIDIPMRRGPAAEAQSCYIEDELIVQEREQLTAALRQDRMLMPKTDGRPDKHTRRKLRERNRTR
jgi:ribosome-associated heat shock protein Hsp15